MTNRVINLRGRGARGESLADIARRTGSYGVAPTDSDAVALAKYALGVALEAGVTAEADRAEAAADFAEGYSGPVYADVAAGEAATTEGQIFRVSNGDGPPETTTAYRRTAGGSVAQSPLATTAALASTDPGKGIELIGDTSMAVRSFEDIENRSIPIGSDMLHTRAYYTGGTTGGADYVEFDEGGSVANDAYVAAHPLTSAKTANNRYFRLRTTEVVSLLQAGAPSNGADASAHFQELIEVANDIEVPAGYEFNINSPVTRSTDGLNLTGTGTIWRDDQFEDFIQLIGCDHHRIIGPTFRTNRTFEEGEWTGTSACIRGAGGSSHVEVSARFENTQFCAVDGNVGSNWHVHDCYFKDIGASAVDIRGGHGHVIVDNYIDQTGDDALTIASHGGESIIARNIVRGAGMIPVWNHPPTLAQGGGGGIRINGSVSVIGNRLYNCNLFFVTAASYSLDDTARPKKCVIAHNFGRGLKPTITVGSPLSIKDSDEVIAYNNNWDVRSDETDVTITNVADNGSGFARVTAPAHGYYTNNRVRILGAGGVTNGVSLITVIDADTFDMTQLAFSGTYTAGGVAYAGLHYARFENTTATRTKRVRIRGDVISNVEAILYGANNGLEELDVADLDVTNYYRATDWAGGFTLNRYRFNRNTLRNPSYTSGALFYASSSAVVTFGNAAVHEINDNTIIQGSVTVNTPLAFGSVVCAAGGRVEALRNKLAGAATHFGAITGLVAFHFDGDHSVERYYQGTGTIASGTSSVTIMHNLGFAPRRSEIEVREVTSGACLCAGLSHDSPFTNSLVVRTSANVAADATVHVSIKPAVRLYVNGSTAA